MEKLFLILPLVALGVSGTSFTKLNLVGKTAIQISTVAQFTADKAIDGSRGTDDCGDTGFSHTDNAINPWWQLDLGEVYTISRVKVMPRRLWDTPMEVFLFETTNSPSRSCGRRYTVIGGYKQQFSCAGSPRARYIQVVRPTARGRKALCLCEVEVFGRRLVNCGIPTAPRNGQASYTTTTRGSRVSYRCNPGYTLRGARIMTCRRSGTLGVWTTGGSHTTNPTCTIVSCGRPRDPVNGYHRETVYTVGSSVTYVCSRGYTISGSSRSTCGTSGDWNTPPPTCTAINCPDPGEPSYGKRNGESFLFDARVTFTCEEGYRRVGPESITCGLDGRWSASRPQCSAITCGTLDTPVNGRVVSGSGQEVGSSRTYACNTGFELNGPETISCQEQNGRGVWSSDIPRCQRMSCGPPSPLQNGQISGALYTYGATVSFLCNRGYRLEGSRISTCLVTGWGGSQTKCNPITCRDPGIPTNGQRSGDIFTFDTVMTYTCDSGYTLKGAASSTCQAADGLWSSRKPECEPVKCPALRIPTYGSKEGDTFEYPNIITFACFPGYSLQGSSTTSCQEDGTWSSLPPTCRPCEVGYYKDSVGDGTCTKCPSMSTTITTASTRKEHCTCLTGSSGPLGGPCRVVTCPQLSAPVNGRISQCQTTMRSECTITCNSGYVLSGGGSRRVCTENGWTGNPVSCTACPKDTYTMFGGAHSCTPCPRNTETIVGSVGQNRQSCICKQGFFGNAGGPCQDFDECFMLNPCNGTCVNTEGSFFCRCDIPGYILSSDKTTCIMNETCKALDEAPSNGSLSCRYTAATNAYVCYIQCNEGYYFVSGINDYITCGRETLFEWSHQLVNKTARIPACTKEFFVDVDLPITLKYRYNETCDDSTLSTPALKSRLTSALESRFNQTVNTISQCNDKCQVHDTTIQCENNANGGSDLTVNWKLLLINVRPNEVPTSCVSTCKQKNMRDIMLSMRSLSIALRGRVKSASSQFELDTTDTPKINPNIFGFTRPKLLCEPGKVFTASRLCVPCDKGHYLPEREMKTCIPCPEAKFQDEFGQTSCKSCLSGSTTLATGSDHPIMCRHKVLTTTIEDNPQ